MLALEHPRRGEPAPSALTMRDRQLRHSHDEPAVPLPPRGVSATRVALAILILVAVIATTADAASRTSINPFNFFGYFTIQSNLMMATMWLGIGTAGLLQRSSSSFTDHLRGFVTTYIAVVGVVYAVLLAPLGAAGGVPLPWANVVLHIVVPVVACLDWIAVPDRRPLLWSRLVLVLIYPLVWLSVVLVRGATDGWVPYPFLDPARGYGAVTLTSLAIAAATVAFGALVFLLSRIRFQRKLHSHRAE